MGLVADLSQAVFRLYDVYKERASTGTVDKASFFAEFVAPTYSLLKTIHGDYLDTFAELRERVSTTEGLSKATVNWLNKVRSAQQFNRSELRETHFPSIQGKGLTEDEADKLNVALNTYSENLRAYFFPPGNSYIGMSSVKGIPMFWGIGEESRMRTTVGLLSKIVELTRTPEEMTLEVMERKLDAEEISDRDILSVPDVALEYLTVATGQDTSLAEQINADAAFYRYHASRYYNDRGNIDYVDWSEMSANARIQEQFIEQAVAELSDEERERWERWQERRASINGLLDVDGWSRALTSYIDANIHHLEHNLAQTQRQYMKIKVMCVP